MNWATTPLLATFMSLLVTTAQGAPVTCEDSLKEIVLARVISTQTRVNFIAGPDRRKPACPSPESTCKLKAFVVPGDEVLMNPGEGPFVCATFKSQNGVVTRGFLPRESLQTVQLEPTSAQKWEGKWLRDSEAEIVISSHEDEVEVSGTATWGGNDPQRVKVGGVHAGELEGSGKPRGQVLAIGYDPEQTDFLPSEDAAPDICATRLELHGPYLTVEDNGGCGGVNVSFTGLYVRAGPNKE
jgi:hypothetical protein